ncbi:helix-turn-helix transcriptional regulator [Paenibacillus hemerocallicola]|uniref:Helix-turn-helix transcriptional regulator n=1 Tax=Paenibacillus hemerocallicola TaxID=1172614 RepID=A0A5C4SX76_9BACL|nr:helix-turn-helix transcriptional regulator [Paenibacillus hemerocallicola]TNJ59075.1 helix-turn-helix transcriptional regulator [Paenibacillus hemerocallicola]
MRGYDKKAVGERIRAQRKALDISQEDFAERIGRVPKFCADIERGQAGMSIETMLSICSLLKLSPNELLFGSSTSTKLHDETQLIIAALNQCTEKQRRDAYALLKLFLTAIR